MDKRITKTEYYLRIATDIAKRGTCLRRNYGAVIVKNDEIIATGYTGAPRGTANCSDIGTCYRVEHNIPSGTQYEKCRSVHAEQNAIISASRQEMQGATLYLSGWEMVGGKYDHLILNPEPCSLCKRFIINAGITDVIAYGNPGTETPEERYNHILVSDWLTIL